MTTAENSEQHPGGQFGRLRPQGPRVVRGSEPSILTGSNAKRNNNGKRRKQITLYCQIKKLSHETKEINSLNI